VILDLGHGFKLRQATEADHPALCMVCLKTGAAGQDATAREDDPDLMGMIYAVPYQVLEPDLAFVIEGSNGVAGYLFGARDTRVFNARLAAEWYPALQARVRDPGADPARWKGSDWARRMIHHPALDIPPALLPYPSHGHIDLLPEARGKGIGRRCMSFLEGRLAAAGSTGLFLDMNPANKAAAGFYERLEYVALADPGLPTSSVFMVKRLA
jgi:ribosomal protein S18 acetylase RimI-like enzyme